jgi:hypothetical protein
MHRAASDGLVVRLLSKPRRGIQTSSAAQREKSANRL